MHKVRVGVLRGGPSNEYDISLQTGETVIKHIPKDTYHIQDILISRDGQWYKDGLPITPHQVLSHVDVIFNALHGYYGEDGKVQHILEQHRIPFTGSGSFASAIGMNKALAKDIFKKANIKTPPHILVSTHSKEISDGEIARLFRTFSPPVVVKPVSGGSSFGVTLVKTLSALSSALHTANQHGGGTVMIEEYIHGREATVGVIEGYRGHDFYALPPIEIRPHAEKGKTFYDYEAKYEDKSDIVVPSTFTKEEKLELEDMARRVHKALGLRHYSRTDFIVSPRRGIYVLEVNTLPGLTDHSCVPKALEAVGASLSHFLDHIIQLSIKKP